MIRWILGIYFISFFLFAFGVLLIRSPIRKFFGRQVEKYVKITKDINNDVFTFRWMLKKSTSIISRLTAKKKFTANLQAMIDRAGISLKASEFIFFHSVALIVAVIIGYAVAGPMMVMLLALMAALLPVLGLKRMESQREKKFHDQLPDTLSLIAGALKAGYSFLQAVDMTVKETSPPMSVEFDRVLTEARLGLPLEHALDNMAKRVNSNNFDWTVMAVKIQREVGGNLSEILEVLADTIRERDRISRQIKVLTAEGRLSAIILFLLPFVVSALLLILNPSYLLMLFIHPLGLGMLAVAVLMLIIGGIWLKKVVTIEV